MHSTLTLKTRLAIIKSTIDMLHNGYAPPHLARMARAYLDFDPTIDHPDERQEIADNYDECLAIISTVIGLPIPPLPEKVD